jgi:DNA-binding LacI/PurR family transcriptional regulator
MTDWIGDLYQIGILAGAVEGAAAAGANLLCFVGGQIPADPSASARHRTFDLIGRHNVDGVVLLASVLIHQVGKAGLAAYCEHNLSGLRLSTVGAKLEGIPNLSPNSVRGIQGIVSHLVLEHGHRRIAFVCGPPASEEAKSRFAAYIAALAQHGIEYDERLVFVGNFGHASGYDAVRAFAQIPGMRLEDLDAIVASNDNMAVGVLRALEERGVAVPGSVAVTGFDDVEDAGLATPPLTTVRQALSKLGRQAARNMLAWTQLGTVPSDEEIDIELVIRRSCGCSGRDARPQPAPLPEMSQGFESALIMRRQHILDSLLRAARGGLGVGGTDWHAKLLAAFVTDLSGETPGALCSLIEDWTQKLTARGGNVQTCQEVVDCLRRQISATLRQEPTRRDRAEEIFHAADRSIGDVVHRGLMRERFKIGRWVRELSVTCNLFAGSQSLTELRLRIERQLTALGIRNYYVVIYDNQDTSSAKLLVANDQRQSVVSAPGLQFDARSLLPTPMLPALGGGRAFAVVPLSRCNESLGHALFELALDHAFSLDVIADAIATGIYTSRLTRGTG